MMRFFPEGLFLAVILVGVLVWASRRAGGKP